MSDYLSISSDVLDSYGLVEPKNKELEQSKSQNSIVPQKVEGAIEVDYNYGGPNAFGLSVNFDSQFGGQKERIDFYRKMRLNPYVDTAIQEIVNEAINFDLETGVVSLDLEHTQFSENIKKKIQEEFGYILRLLNFESDAYDLFEKFYVDGQLNFFKVVNKDRPKDGILELREIDARYIRKVSEVKRDVRSQRELERDEYYVYDDPRLAKRDKGVRLNGDSVARSWSGKTNENNEVVSHLEKAIVPYNQLNNLEVAVLVYFISRAPERLVFYVDTGLLPKNKADAYVRSVANKYQNKQVYNPDTGVVEGKKSVQTMLENIWLPRQDGSRGTEVNQIGGSIQLAQQIEVVDAFKTKLYQALNVPLGRLQKEGGQFDFGRASEITRDEVNFVKFIRRLQNRFSILILDVLRSQLVLKNILTTEEWEEESYNIRTDFSVDSVYEESKNIEMVESRLRLLRDANEYVKAKGGFFSREWVFRNILMLNEEQIKKMQKEIDEEVKSGAIPEEEGRGF